MNVVDISRWQFGITTVYHFIFVPLTTLSVATLRQDEIQQATGLYSLLRNFGASIGISLMGVLSLAMVIVRASTSRDGVVKSRKMVESTITNMMSIVNATR